MFGRPVGEEDNVFFRAIKKAGYPGLPYSKGGMLGPCSAIYTSALICARDSITPVVRVSSIVFQSKDEQALIIPRVKNRVREFLNTATSDTWFNFPEAFGIAVNLGYGSIYGLHESLGCSPIETNSFEIFMPGVLIEA